MDAKRDAMTAHIGFAEPLRTSFFSLPIIIVAAATAVAYAPTLLSLMQGPWQTEQEGHGPFIIALAIYLVWQGRESLRTAEMSPAPLLGWLSLLFGLLMMFISRTQDVLTFEVLSILPVLAGEVLLLGGFRALRVLLFPIGFLIFAVPAPDWAIDTLTVPLKVMISDAVTELLYRLDYPIAQNGVMIMIGTYKLLVKDACSGMNSIFALSAIGVFYAYAFRWGQKARAVLLLLAIVPITIAVNFLRVLSLVLIAYYGGVDRLDGFFHDATGIGLFVLALALLFAFDMLLGLIGIIWRKTASVLAWPSQYVGRHSN
jgi:exosortase